MAKIELIIHCMRCKESLDDNVDSYGDIHVERCDCADQEITDLEDQVDELEQKVRELEEQLSTASFSTTSLILSS